MAEPSPITEYDDRCVASLLREGRALRGLARHLLRDAEAGDDVVQDAVLAAWQQRIEGDRAGAWLQVVTRRLALLARRRLVRRREREALAARAEAVPSVLDAAVTSEVARDVSAAVAALEEPFRTAVVLRFWHGLPPRAIARRLGVPVNTVRSRIQRGLARLREQLDGRHGGERMGWAVPLAGIAFDGSAAVLTTTLGGVLVGTTTKVVGSVAAAMLVVWALWAGLAEPEVGQGGAGLAGVAPRVPGAQVPPERASVGQPAVGERAAVATPPAAQDVDVVLVGRLLDESDLAPLAQASIGWLDESAQQAQSGADGRFELSLRGVGERSFLSLWTEADGFARERRSCSLRELAGTLRRVDLGDLQLAPGTELTGRVVDIAGLPVAGAQLFLSQRGTVYSASQMHGSDVLDDAMPLAESDATGWFRSAHRVVPQGFEVFVIAAAPEGLGWALVRPTRHAGRLDVQVVLDQGAAPTVAVRDVDGQPIEGVMVEALPRFAPLGHEGIADVEGLACDGPVGARFVSRSDADGLARFSFLPRGEGQNWGSLGAYRFRVSAEGYRERRMDVELVAGEPRLEVVLLRDRPFDLVVEVRAREDGRPLADARIRVEERSATTDREGRVTFEAFHTEREELRYGVLAAGRVRASGSWSIPAAAELRVAVELEAAATLTGRVVDQHGDPVAGARVFVDGPKKAETDAEGRFAVEGLPITPVSVVVHPPEPVGAWEPVPFAEPLRVSEQPKLFVLQRRVEGLATLDLEVVDMATGRPASPEPVWLRSVDERGLWTGGQWQPGSTSIGRARLEGVQPGRYELSVARLAKRIVVIGPADRLVPLRIEVGQPGVIEGELVLAEGGDLVWPETVSVSVGPVSDVADWVAPEGGELVTDAEHGIVLAAKLTPARSTRFRLVDADPHRVISLTAQGGGLIGRASFRVPPGGVARPRLVLAPASALLLRFAAPCPWHELEFQTRPPGGEWSLPVRYGWMGGREELHVPLPAGAVEWRLSSMDPDSGQSVLRGPGSVQLIAGQGSEVDVKLGD